jgi:glycine cleavage system aminomethyltransferase T
VKAGAGGFAVANHMFQPHSYDDMLEEHRYPTEGANLWDGGSECQVEIIGPYALSFTKLLTPRDVSACAVGRGRYFVIRSQEGGIMNDLILFRLAENYFWVSVCDSDLILWAKGIAVLAGMDVNIS